MASRVEIDAKQNILLTTDEDRFRKKYQYEDDDLLVTFSSPRLEVLELNKFFLLSKSVKKILPRKYYYKPDYMSFEEYKTETLWYVLLFVNNICCIEDFDKYEIFIPPYGAILELIKKDLSKEIITIGKEPPVSAKLLNLYSSKIKPVIEDGDNEEENKVDEKALYWVRQKFEINIGQETNGYIDLAYEVIEDTLTVKMEHGGNFIYNVDYKLIKTNDGQIRRLSWRDLDCEEGPGLLDTIKSGMMLEVLFAKKQQE